MDYQQRRHGRLRSRRSPRRVVFLAFPGTVLLDLAGPWDVLNNANLSGDLVDSPYALELIAADDDVRIRTLGGPPLLAHEGVSACCGPIDTLVVPGAYSPGGTAPDDLAVEHVRRLACLSRRIVSVCGGASVLAAAGLLDGRRVTTHWRACAELASRYPSLRVEPDCIFVRDGNVYTSAGVTAGMDLALALVEEDLGRPAALAVAKSLVMFARRPGGQAQFSVLLQGQTVERNALRDLLGWVAENLDQDLTIDALATRANMSVRNFSRVFQQEVGRSPGRHIELIRLEAAKQRLENLDIPLGRVASECGFGGVNSLRRSFLRVLKVTPTDYRARFQ